MTSALSALRQVGVRNSSFLDEAVVLAGLLFIDAFISFNQKEKKINKGGKTYTGASSEVLALRLDNCYGFEESARICLESG